MDIDQFTKELAETKPPNFFNQEPRDRGITFAGGGEEYQTQPSPKSPRLQITEQSMTFEESAVSAQEMAQKLITASVNTTMINEGNSSFLKPSMGSPRCKSPRNQQTNIIMAVEQKQPLFNPKSRQPAYVSGLHYIVPHETPFDVNSLLYVTHYLLNQAGIIYDNKSYVDQLQQEINNWVLLKKLCKKDQEIEQIKNLVSYHQEDLKTVVETIENELKRIEESKQQKQKNMIENLQKQFNDLTAYLNEIQEQKSYVTSLEGKKDNLDTEFNESLPELVLKARQNRQDLTQSDVPGQKKDLELPRLLKELEINNVEFMHCKDLDKDLMRGDKVTAIIMSQLIYQFSGPVKDLLRELLELHTIRNQLDQKYAHLQMQQPDKYQVKIYKAIANDDIDQEFAKFINKSKLPFEVKRLGKNEYMFGTKKIHAKMVNGRLLIRVGGGFMYVEQFIQQYAKIEILKMQQRGLLEGGPSQMESGQDNKQQKLGFRMQDIKEHMLEQMGDVQVYDNINTKDAMRSAFDSKSRDVSAAKQQMRKSIPPTDDRNNISPMKRARSAIGTTPVNKRGSFTTDPQKREQQQNRGLNIGKFKQESEGTNQNDKSPLRPGPPKTGFGTSFARKGSRGPGGNMNNVSQSQDFNLKGGLMKAKLDESMDASTSKLHPSQVQKARMGMQKSTNDLQSAFGKGNITNPPPGSSRMQYAKSPAGSRFGTGAGAGGDANVGSRTPVPMKFKQGLKSPTRTSNNFDRQGSGIQGPKTNLTGKQSPKQN